MISLPQNLPNLQFLIAAMHPVLESLSDGSSQTLHHVTSPRIPDTPTTLACRHLFMMQPTLPVTHLLH